MANAVAAKKDYKEAIKWYLKALEESPFASISQK